MSLATPIPLPVKPGAKVANPFLVTAIGSCRVTNPLRRLPEISEFSLNQSGVYGYTHSSAEALQQIDVMQGKATIPAHLKPFVAPNQTSAPHRASDLYLVELSSAKVLSVDGVCVQLNYFNAHFSALFADRNFARDYWKVARDGSTEAMRKVLDRMPGIAALPRAEQDVLLNMRLSLSSEATLEREITAIRAALPDVMFVTHFNAITPTGPIRSRRNYIALVRAVMAELGATVFDPSDYVEAFGQDTALEPENQSLTHYSPAFEKYLLDHWINRYLAPRAAERVASGTAVATPVFATA